MHGCLDCGKPLAKSVIDNHPYRYDHGEPVRLRSVTKYACACGYYEIEIPRMGPLHEAIEQALHVMDPKRDGLEFFFTSGPKGVEDGAWGVLGVLIA